MNNEKEKIRAYLIKVAKNKYDFSTMGGKAKATSFLFPFLDYEELDEDRQCFIKLLGKELGIGAHAIETKEQQ